MLRTYLIDETGGRSVLIANSRKATVAQTTAFQRILKMLRSVRNPDDYGQRVSIRAEVRDVKTDALYRRIEGTLSGGRLTMRGVQII